MLPAALLPFFLPPAFVSPSGERLKTRNPKIHIIQAPENPDHLITCREPSSGVKEVSREGERGIFMARTPLLWTWAYPTSCSPGLQGFRDPRRLLSQDRKEKH